MDGNASIEVKTCPFEFTGTVRRMTVINEMNSKQLYYTQKSGEAIITIGFKSEEKGITDTSWNEVMEDAVIKVEVDRGVSGSYETIIDGQMVLNGNTFSFDVFKYLATGNNRIRVIATGVDTDSSANLVYQVLLTSMYLSPAQFKWNIPFVENQAFSLGGLYIGGNIDKILKIKVSNEQTYSKIYEVNIGTQTHTSIAYYYNNLEFPTEGTGVYNVELWLDANGLESEHLHYNIICVAQADVKTVQLIAVSNVLSTVKNYDTNKLFSYSVYNGGATTASPVVNVSAIINNTPTVLVKDEILENVATGEINDYNIDLEIDTQEYNIQLYSSIELGDSKQEAVYAIDNTKAYPAVAGAIFYMNPANRNNQQTNKNIIVNESNNAKVPSEYSATWSNVSYTDGMDGWTVDNEGRKCLRLPATSKVEIDYAPFANSTTRTIEVSYKVENASDYNEDIISIASELTSQFVGARVKPTNVLLHSSLLRTDDLMQGYNTKDEELVHLLITVIQNYKQIGNLAQIYVNGVKKCSFEWSASDTFDNAGTIKIGSDTADLYIYKMRVYSSAFDWIMASQNFLSCLPDTKSKEAAYNKLHSVLNDGNQIDYDTVKKNGYNYFVLRLPQGKSLPSILSQSSVSGTRLVINIQQNKNFVINGTYEDEETEGQGTTAMNYFRWNLRWKTDTIRVTAKKNYASSMHSHKMGATALFNDLNRMIVGANEADARVAVEQYGAYGFIEELIEGTTDQYTYIPIGLYTIGQDKGDKATFGYNNKTYKPTLIHLEGTDHSPKAVGMDYPWDKINVATNSEGDANLGVQKTDGTVIAAWEIGACGSAESDAEMYQYLTQEFKPAYNVDYLNTSMIVGLDSDITIDMVNANLTEFRALETDNGYTYGDCLIWIDGEYDTYYYDVIQNKYIKDGVNILTDLGISASDLKGTNAMEKNLEIRALRMARYRAEMENYWHLRDNLFHYCFIVLFAATDNFKKNTYPYKFGTLASGSRWRWRQDDLDTLFDINNQGLANKIYSLMNGDKSGTTHLFRGNTSYHWTNIQFYYENEIKSMMLEIMTAMASLGKGGSLIEKAIDCIRKYFWNKAQDYFTKSAYNLDAEWSYEEAWAAMKNGTYAAPVHPLQQSLGSHYEAERAFVELRFIFMASMYGFGAFAVGNDSDISLGQISFRPAQGDNTFHLTPAINMNPTILVGDSDAKSAEQRLQAGDTADITISTDGDTSIYIQGTDYLSDIGDFSQINLYAENPQLSVQGKRLQTLKVGDESAEKVKTILKSLNILACPSLSEIDARNVSTLTGTIDLSQCPRLKRALFGGSSAGEIILPKGSKIEEFELPDSITNISLVNLPNLTEEGLQYGDLTALTYLRVEGNANIEGFALLKATFEDGAPLTNIRVIGFDYDGDANDATLLATLANGNYFGIDSDGTRNPNIIPVIEGTLNIDGSIYEDDAKAIEEAYGQGLVLNVTGGYYIKFQDPEVLRVLLAKGVGDGNGITTEQAEVVTTIGTWFSKNTVIKSFDELEKFVGVQSFADAAFLKCTGLETITLPKGLEQTSINMFSGCTSLVEVRTKNPLKILESGTFKECSLFEGIDCSALEELRNKDTGGGVFKNTNIKEFNAPNLKTIGTVSCTVHFMGTPIKRVINLGSVTILPSGNSNYGLFKNCKQLYLVNLPSTLQQIGAYSFDGCSNITEMNIPNSIKSIGDCVFRGCTSLEIEDLQLPNLETLGQNAFYGVKIKKMVLGKEGGTLTLPAGSSSIQNYGDKSVLEEVELHEVTSIPSNSFSGYTNITSCIISGVTNIGYAAFMNTTFTNMDCSSVTIFANKAFYTSKIENIILRDVVNLGNGGAMDEGLFYKCPMTFIDMPESLESIGNYAFLGSKIATVICRAIAPPSGSNMFYSTPISSGNGVIYVPNESVTAYREASGWNSYADRIFPISVYNEGGVSNIIEFADPAVEALCLANWDNNKDGYLTRIEAAGVTSLGTVFKGNTEITSFDELNEFTGLTSIANKAFYGCTNLNNVSLPESVTHIGEMAFRESGLLNCNLVLKNITSVEPGAFYGTKVRSIIMPDVVKVHGAYSKGYRTFAQCANLEYVLFGKTVTDIAAYIFSDSRQNTIIVLAETPPTFNGDSFGYSGAVQSIYVPDSSETAYEGATNWSRYASMIKPLSQLATDNPSLYEEISEYL